jgi:putative transposase
MDNVFTERLRRSLKYKSDYLHAFETGSELPAGLTQWIGHYNANRPHLGLGGRTPNEAYGVAELMRLADWQQSGPSLTWPSNCPIE